MAWYEGPVYRVEKLSTVKIKIQYVPASASTADRAPLHRDSIFCCTIPGTKCRLTVFGYEYAKDSLLRCYSTVVAEVAAVR